MYTEETCYALDRMKENEKIKDVSKNLRGIEWVVVPFTKLRKT